MSPNDLHCYSSCVPETVSIQTPQEVALWKGVASGLRGHLKDLVREELSSSNVGESF